jgi:hypothetical protein
LAWDLPRNHYGRSWSHLSLAVQGSTERKWELPRTGLQAGPALCEAREGETLEKWHSVVVAVIFGRSHV